MKTQTEPETAPECTCSLPMKATGKHFDTCPVVEDQFAPEPLAADPFIPKPKKPAPPNEDQVIENIRKKRQDRIAGRPPAPPHIPGEKPKEPASQPIIKPRPFWVMP